MTTFLRLAEESDKAVAISSASSNVRSGASDSRVFEVNADAFSAIPGAPFAYWVSERVRSLFGSLPKAESDARRFTKGLCTTDDDRFLRAWWEIEPDSYGVSSEQLNGSFRWASFAKGGEAKRFYGDISLVLKWSRGGEELKHFLDWKIGREGQWSRWINSVDYYFRPGITWPLRASHFSPQVLPSGCIFSVRGYAAFAPPGELAWLLGLMGSSPFDYIFKTMLGRFGHPEFVVGAVQQMPVPELDADTKSELANLARRAWSLKRRLASTVETTHAFLLPTLLRSRAGRFDPPSIEAELKQIQVEIDSASRKTYGLIEADLAVVGAGNSTASEPLDVVDSDEDERELDDDNEDVPTNGDPTSELLSWALGVAYGRFDWRLATGERNEPQEPDPLDPLPAKSPGMLPDYAEPFHAHDGILVDDVGHPHDLVRVVEELLARVDIPVPSDLRRWVQKDFFSFHLQRYSKSRRKAPIYWPLSTVSGNYTLWVYYPSLTSQTAYTAVNDFVEPKLKQVGGDLAVLRNKGADRTRDDEKRFEALQAFELELIELRDSVLRLAPTYKPHHDDGVQISAAPLWSLFRYKPWQKLLKDTWTKLEKGEYDWAHLAMNYWPDRVREKCRTDKSLAIAHGLESLYVEPEAVPKKTRGRKKGAEA